jgi:outer membrane protein W
MKSTTNWTKASAIILLLVLISPLISQAQIKSTGIGVRGSYYGNGDQEMEFVSVDFEDHMQSANVGAGGSLFIFSRFADQWFMEFTVGGLARVNTEHKVWLDEEVEVFSAVPMLVGVKYDILPLKSKSFLRPYISIGPGVYIISDVQVQRVHGIEHGHVSTKVRGGAHAAAGFNFFFTETFGLNFETKYHMVDFDPNHNRSGYELGIGLLVMWGDYEDNSHQVSLNIKN